MAKAQEHDPEIQALKDSSTGLVFEEVSIPNSNKVLLCDVSTGITRPVVPNSWQRKVFDIIHGLSHPGIRATRRLIASKYVWKNLNSKVNE